MPAPRWLPAPRAARGPHTGCRTWSGHASRRAAAGWHPACCGAACAAAAAAAQRCRRHSRAGPDTHPPHGGAARRAATQVVHATTAGAGGHTRHRSDVVALSNLCVDVFHTVPSLPVFADTAAVASTYASLVASSRGQEHWEVGGNTNFAIAASRLGLACTCLGHTGDDAFGAFMRDVLRHEGVAVQELLPPAEAAPAAGAASVGDGAAAGERPATLLCFVLIDPSNGHAFCSRFDFDARPLLTCSSSLPGAWRATLASTAAVFVNGFAFDDLEPDTIMACVSAASSAGAVIAFDVGPRAGALMRDAHPGTAGACARLLATSDVLLMTQDEAHTLTRCANADAAAQELLRRSMAPHPWVIIKQGSQGAVALTRGASPDHPPVRVAMPACSVAADQLQDTVGCGDSFAAAVVLGRTRGHDLETTLALANAVGAATATRRGAGRNVARLGEVRALLADMATAADGRVRPAAREAARRALALVGAAPAA